MIKTTTIITCDECGYSTDISSVNIKTYQLDNLNNNWWYGWTAKELCDKCAEQHNMGNPSTKIREWIKNL